MAGGVVPPSGGGARDLNIVYKGGAKGEHDYIKKELETNLKVFGNNPLGKYLYLCYFVGQNRENLDDRKKMIVKFNNYIREQEQLVDTTEWETDDDPYTVLYDWYETQIYSECLNAYDKIANNSYFQNHLLPHILSRGVDVTIEALNSDKMAPSLARIKTPTSHHSSPKYHTRRPAPPSTRSAPQTRKARDSLAQRTPNLNRTGGGGNIRKLKSKKKRKQAYKNDKYKDTKKKKNNKKGKKSKKKN